MFVKGTRLTMSPTLRAFCWSQEGGTVTQSWIKDILRPDQSMPGQRHINPTSEPYYDCLWAGSRIWVRIWAGGVSHSSLSSLYCTCPSWHWATVDSMCSMASTEPHEDSWLLIVWMLYNVHLKGSRDIRHFIFSFPSLSLDISLSLSFSSSCYQHQWAWPPL